ncbi:SPFH domain-containing protein [Streptomyces paludis]
MTTTSQSNDDVPDLRGVFVVRPESSPADAGYGVLVRDPAAEVAEPTHPVEPAEAPPEPVVEREREPERAYERESEREPEPETEAVVEAGPAVPSTVTVPASIPDVPAVIAAPAVSAASFGPANGDGRVNSGQLPRWNPLIVGEATQEIPVHLLFRDEADALEAAGGPARSTVIGRRRGTGEQPRVREWVRAPAPAPVRPPRAAPPCDPRLAERPGPALPGWAAVLTGTAALLGCAAAVWWAGALPAGVSGALRLPSRPYHGPGVGAGLWVLLAVGLTVALLAFGGLGRGRVGQAWVLTLFGDYRGSVRRTGLLWMSPLLLRRGVDVRLRHWRSEPMPAVDSNGTALRVVVLVIWRVGDTVRAALGVQDHEEYLREQVEAAMARVLSQLPADAFHDEAPTLRDAEAVGDALTRLLSAECLPVGIDVFSAQPTRIEYAPEIAAAMQRSRIAAIDAQHRDSVLTSVVDAVDDTVGRLTSRGLVELDDYERKALVKDLTVAFYTGRQGGGERL